MWCHHRTAPLLGGFLPTSTLMPAHTRKLLFCFVLGSLKTTYFKKPVRDMSTEWTPGKVLRVS